MDTRADLRRQLRVLALADAFVYMCPAVYTTFLSAFYTRQGLTGTQTGILFGISPLMYILIQPLWARLADRSGRRREVLQIICVGSAAALLCFYLGSGFAAYLPAALLLSGFVTAMAPISDSIILIQAARHDLPFAKIRLAGTLGYIAIVLLCGRLFTAHPEWMFGCASAMFLMYACAACLLPVDAGDAQRQRAGRRRQSGLRAYIRGEFLFLLLFAFCGYVGLSFCTTYSGAYLTRLGFDQMTVAIASVISAVSEVPVLLVLSRRMERMKPLRMMAFACLMTALRTLLTGSGVLVLMLLAQLLQSVSYMLMYYCGAVFISRRLPEELQSSGQSLLVLVQSGCGSLVGSVAGGRLVDAAGMQNGFFAYGALTLAGVAALWTALQWRNRKGEHVA